MKTLILLISSMTFYGAFNTNINAMSSMNNKSVEDSIHVWSSPDLFDITTTWVSEYAKNNPEAKISVSSIPADKLHNKIKAISNIGLITKEQLPTSNTKPIWKMVVGRDIIVPVMNKENPYMDEIYKKGISSEDFASVYAGIEKQIWGTLLNNDLPEPVNCYCIKDEFIKSHLTEFLQTDLTSMNAIDVANIDEMLKGINNDKYAIGFCRLVNIFNFENQEIEGGASLIPIDINMNNKVDYFEDIYNNLNDLARGVWIGKYPRDLFSNIYTVAGDQPVNSNELAFLEYLISEGQQYLHASGYSELLFSERQAKVKSLYAHQIPTIDIKKRPIQSSNVLTSSVLVILGIMTGLVIILVVAFIIYLLVQTTRILIYGEQAVEVNEEIISSVFTENLIKVPGGLFFDKSHTWAFMERDGHVRIGIDDFLQHVTGPITRVKMKNPGEKIKKGETFLSLIQHGKQLKIQSPVSGIIKENNVKLNSNSTFINSAPYSEGWVYVIDSTNWLKEIKALFMGETYRLWLKNEFSRLKDFLSSTLRQEDENLQLVMQDGGELKDSLLEFLGPEIWEEFQSRFINLSK